MTVSEYDETRPATSLHREILDLLDRTLQVLPPGPWTARPEPDSDKVYLSGPPGTRLVADNLTLEDANAFTVLVEVLPDFLRKMRFLVDSWEYLVSSPNDRDDSALINGLVYLQTEIARLSGTDLEVAAEKASDLTYKHISHNLTLTDGEVFLGPITAIRNTAGGRLIQVYLTGNSYVYLQPGTLISVQ